MDLPFENGGSFHSYVNVYQRVDATLMPNKKCLDHWINCHPPTDLRICKNAVLLWLVPEDGPHEYQNGELNDVKDVDI